MCINSVLHCFVQLIVVNLSVKLLAVLETFWKMLLNVRLMIEKASSVDVAFKTFKQLG